MSQTLPSAVSLSSVQVRELQHLATLIRMSVVKMVYHAKSGHLAGALGLAEIYALLYQEILHIDPHQPLWPERDYLLVSNGHTCAVWYAALAQAGFFSKLELATFREINSRLQGHPHFLPSELESDQKTLPGIENTSGPLGQGLSQAAGLALGLKKLQKPNQVFCLLSDGEHQEGQIWEAYMFASHHHLTNLIPIIDFNHIQISGRTESVMSLGALDQKLRAFGWDVWVVDGHNLASLYQALRFAQTSPKKPTAILAQTIPGKGVGFMENDFKWHGKVPSQTDTQHALTELGQILHQHHSWPATTGALD